MNNNYEQLYKVLRMDSRLLDNNGELLRNKIITLGEQLDSNLLKLLLNNEVTRRTFFKNIDDIVVFDKLEFMWIINSNEFLPNSYTRFSNKIFLSDLNNRIISKSEDVVLLFPNKDCILEFDSTNEEIERKENFLNITLAKDNIDVLLEEKVFVNATKHSRDKQITINKLSDDDNLIIKGNNLIVMHSLLPRFKERIKLMYWDILYNTKNDKVPYNDSFKHSSWLTMMKNRLEVGYRLLKNDGGIICLQCDDNEQAYLKVLCDEIFGRENFVNCICIKMSDASGPKMAHIEKRFPKIKEYLLVYKKGEINLNIIKERKRNWDKEYKVFFDISKELMDKFHSNALLDNEINEINSDIDEKVINIQEAYKKYNITKDKQDEFNIENAWRIARSSNAITLKKFLDEHSFNKKTTLLRFNDSLMFSKTNYDKSAKDPRVQFVFAMDTMDVPLCDLWTEINTSFNSEGGVTLVNGQKPEKLLKYIIETMSNPNDIVLDAYLGSGTTSAVCHKLNRKYIGIEQLDKHFDMAQKRMQNVVAGDKSGISSIVNWGGGGEYISIELAKNNQKYIDIISKTSNEEDLLDIFRKISESDFANWRVNTSGSTQEILEFSELENDEKKKIIIELLDKNLLYINFSERNDKNYELKSIDIEFSESFYKAGN